MGRVLRLRALAAALFAALAVASSSAQAHELTATQERVFKVRLQKSKSVLSWWGGRGRWALFGRHQHCWQIGLTPRHRRICTMARVSLRAHRARVVRLERLLAPPPPPAPADPAGAICAVFGPYCQQAVAVARCESGLSIYARNGQYLGLFQMGDYARATYGHAWDALGQARAAYRYFVAAGFSWRPWSCQP